MNMSDVIERFLLEMLQNEPDVTLKRNELAEHFRCAPSQINYVISTRFTGQRGYEVESQRGGGGYIKIRRVQYSGSNYIMHVINTIGSSISYQSAGAMLSNMSSSGIINTREERIMRAALSYRDMQIPQSKKDEYRANQFKNMLISLI